ncbi:unnamed protein product [Caenorhabditis auriculariae]|uniref:Androgen-dependent TFPI-regulating protein-like n=1 Tax=Caenorhabditis auriculariae TaxID=2777116 RepID=A0A8S1GVG1_9PELO|nr:unnamed protein product [Caenorhabditis auriculariae]
MFKFLASLILSSVWVYSVYFDVTSQPRLGHEWYIYKLVMLTNLNLILDTVYSVLVVLSILCPKEGKLPKIVDFIFHTSVYPTAVITCVLFWSLYVLDPGLVMPEWIASLIPNWLNHVTHTYPVVFVLFDNILHERRSPNLGSSLTASAMLVLIYFVIIFYVKYMDGYWLYPLLSFLSREHFFVAYFAAVVGYFLISQFAKLQNNFIWGQETMRKWKNK